MTTQDRLHRTVLWSGGLWLMSFPLMMLYLAVIGMVAQSMDIDPDLPEDATADLVLNLVYMAMVLATLGAAAVIGLRGWRRHGQRLALAAAIASGVTAVVFVLLPALAPALS